MERNGVTISTHGAARDRSAIAGRIVVLEGPEAPAEIAIGPRGATIGQSRECELRLTDERVSGQHLHVMIEDEQFRVRDLGSTNGSYFHGARFDDIAAPPGATIVVGRTTLQLLRQPEYSVVPPSEASAFGEMLGGSLPMREIFGLLERVAGSDAPVLVQGETGTGKELVARALHQHSPRADGRLVVVDCSAIPADLIESELFGHLRGAFTGAVGSREGAFARASGGVLFLDEIGELPLDLQPKLLRVLESREVRPVGSDEPRPVDVRVVAATHRELDQMVCDQTFRADLYYRLAVVQVWLPPLRSRLDDLPLLIERLLRGAGVEQPGPIEGPALTLLRGHAWPGNVRELRNVLERAVACAGTREVAFAELPLMLGRMATARAASGGAADGAPAVDIEVPFSRAKEALIDRFERDYLAAMLEATSGNVAEAARRAGLNRRHLYQLLTKHGLR